MAVDPRELLNNIIKHFYSFVSLQKELTHEDSHSDHDDSVASEQGGKP